MRFGPRWRRLPLSGGRGVTNVTCVCRQAHQDPSASGGLLQTKTPRCRCYALAFLAVAMPIMSLAVMGFEALPLCLTSVCPWLQAKLLILAMSAMFVASGEWSATAWFLPTTDRSSGLLSCRPLHGFAAGAHLSFSSPVRRGVCSPRRHVPRLVAAVSQHLPQPGADLRGPPAVHLAARPSARPR